LLNVTDLSFSVRQINEKQKAVLARYRSVHYEIYDHTDTLFSAFLKDLMTSLLKQNKIYLIYFEKGPQPVSRSRSYQKMFGRDKHLKSSEVIEYEHPIGAKQSLKTAIITLTLGNHEHCLKLPLSGLFEFDYIVPKGRRSFRENRQVFLKDVASGMLEEYQLVKVNIYLN